MKRLVLLLLALGLACQALPGAAQDIARPAVQAAGDATARQVLVMLRIPPQHFRPDSSYGGAYADDGTRAARKRQAQELAAAHGLALVGDWPMPAIGIDCFVMEDRSDAPIGHVLDALARDPRVAWAQAIGLYRGLESPAPHRADPLYPLQPAARAWRLAELHRASKGRQVAVAVIDSGVDGSHPDLAGQLALRKNFVDAVPDAPETHGTAVAGIIAARAGNGLGIEGIAPQARLMALRACWEGARQETLCNTFTLGKALHFALLGDARIINLSLGGPPDRLLQALIDAALARGMTVVGAVDPQRADGGFPASHPGVIAVTVDGDRRSLPAGVLQAPGTDVPTALPGARWGMVSGSSYAAAHVAGLAALLGELRPRMAPAHLLTGNIDACAVVARAAQACVCLCPSTAAVTTAMPRQP